LAILAYRPTRDDWGAVEGYWNGDSLGLQVEDDQMNYQTDWQFQYEFLSRPYILKCELTINERLKILVT